MAYFGVAHSDPLYTPRLDFSPQSLTAAFIFLHSTSCPVACNSTDVGLLSALIKYKICEIRDLTFTMTVLNKSISLLQLSCISSEFL